MTILQPQMSLFGVNRRLPSLRKYEREGTLRAEALWMTDT